MDAILSPTQPTLVPRAIPRPRFASEAENQAYFQHQLKDSQTWAARMGLDFHETIRPGQKILDFGCGHGALSIQAARYGADVTGIDTNPHRIDFATRAAAAFPQLAPALHFQCIQMHSLEGQNRFDMILSKDSFAHAENPAAILAHFHRMLRRGACAYIGFSRGKGALTPAAFRAMAAKTGFTIVTMRVNQAEGLKQAAVAPLNLARKIPALERLATFNIYATLRK